MTERNELNPQFYRGCGVIANILPKLNCRNCKKVFVISDPELLKSGVTKKVTDLLDAALFPYEVYSDTASKDIQKGVDAFQQAGADCIVAIGGDSAMDTAKAIGLAFNKFDGLDRAPMWRDAVFTIAVPTTSDIAEKFSVLHTITDLSENGTSVIVDLHDIPEVTVADSDLMVAVPSEISPSPMA